MNDINSITTQSENIRRLARQRKLIDDEISILEAQMRESIFTAFNIKFRSKIKIDLDDVYGLCDYVVLDFHITDGEPTIRVIREESMLAIGHHLDRNPHDEGYADKYGIPATLDRFKNAKRPANGYESGNDKQARLDE